MKTKIVAAICVCALLLSLVTVGNAFAASQGVVINEICASNNGEGDMPKLISGSGSYCDWIELYNSGEQRVDIGGWGLSDKKSAPFKAVLPENMFIEPDEYLLICCSTDYTGAVPCVKINISADGENILLTPKGQTDSETVKLPATEQGTVYGRVDGGFAVMYPSPGKANNTAKKYIAPPVFSQTGGFYTDGFTLNISCAANAAIYYTTDGSDPDNSQTSIEYTGGIEIKDRTGDKNVLAAISPSTFAPADSTKRAPDDDMVDKASVIRACVKDGEGNLSATVTNTYFVGEKVCSYGEIPVLSVTTDYENLYDYNTGIYTNGKTYDEYKKQHPNKPDSWDTDGNFSNRGREWERDCNIEYYDEQKRQGFSQKCGMRIQGGASRSSIQKSLRFVARSEYGKSRFECDIFGSEGESKYKSIVVRNGGNSSGYLKLCDSYLQRLVRGRSFTTQAAKACLVFIDGEFWGIYNLQEDYCRQYLGEKFGVDDEHAAIIKSGWKLEDGTDADMREYRNNVSQIAYGEMSDNEQYKTACEIIDIDGYIEYMAAQIYINNSDWPGGNWSTWYSGYTDESNPYADKRWRMLMFDTEFSTALYKSEKTVASTNNITRVTQSTNRLAIMFVSLMKNKEFKRKFILTLTDMMNYDYGEQRRTEIFEEMYQHYLPYLKMNIDRFNMGSIYNMNQRRDEILNFFDLRGGYITKYLAEYYNFENKMHTLTVTTNLPEGGTIALNTLKLDLSELDNAKFSGKYFDCFDMTIDAIANEGYRFAGFEGVESGSFRLTGDTKVIAVFEKLSDLPPTNPTVSPTNPTVSLTSTTAAAVRGDANADGSINAKDVLLIRRHIAKYPSKINTANADTNGDGTVNAKDVLLVRKHIAKLIKL